MPYGAGAAVVSAAARSFASGRSQPADRPPATPAPAGGDPRPASDRLRQREASSHPCARSA